MYSFCEIQFPCRLASKTQLFINLIQNISDGYVSQLNTFLFFFFFFSFTDSARYLFFIFNLFIETEEWGRMHQLRGGGSGGSPLRSSCFCWSSWPVTLNAGDRPTTRRPGRLLLTSPTPDGCTGCGWTPTTTCTGPSTRARSHSRCRCAPSATWYSAYHRADTSTTLISSSAGSTMDALDSRYRSSVLAIYFYRYVQYTSKYKYKDVCSHVCHHAGGRTYVECKRSKLVSFSMNRTLILINYVLAT